MYKNTLGLAKRMILAGIFFLTIISFNAMASDPEDKPNGQLRTRSLTKVRKAFLNKGSRAEEGAYDAGAFKGNTSPVSKGNH